MSMSRRFSLFLNVVLSMVGILAFLLDLAADLWAIVQYYRAGRYLWAALVLALMGFSSVLLQLFSWIWLTADSAELHESQPPRPFLALLHVLQLGYLYRCLQGLEQVLSMWYKGLPSECDLAYADFLSLDVSMLRLLESFLEATPQLTLVLAIVFQSGQAEYYQWFGISSALLGISWALLDYHRSLRTCLPSKLLMGWSSSAVYFLWNLLLLGPRIFTVALFSALFHYYVALHFLSLWLMLMFWIWLQGTKFMPGPNSEWLYRMAMAFILYFSWFNVSEGHTRGRAIIHIIFILSDSVLLASAVVIHSTWLPRASLLPMWLTIGGACFLLGLILRVLYYLWLHPRLGWKPDQVDQSVAHLSPKQTQYRRATQIAQNFFPKAKGQAALPEARQLKGFR